MMRRIAGSEADHRRRGYPIVTELGRRRVRRPLLPSLSAAVAAFLSLYFGKRP